METNKDKKALIVFFCITVVLSLIFYYVRIKGGDAARGMTTILMWMPGLAAIIVKIAFYRGEKLLGFNKFKPIYALFAVLAPIVYMGISYPIYWLIAPQSFSGNIYSDSPLMIILLFFSSFVGATGEEIGWRGYLLPKLTSLKGVTFAVIVSGLFWAVWHFPLMITGMYQSGAELWFALPVFTVEILAMSVILAFLRLKSKSVYPAIILHAVHNYIDDVFMIPLTKGDSHAYFVGETGFITALILIIIAGSVILCVRKKKTVEN